MFLTTHALVGAMVGEAAPDPISAFFLGATSHFIIDMIPHGDSKQYDNYKNKEKVKRALAYVISDAALAIITVEWMHNSVTSAHPLNRTMGIIGGILPDLLIGLAEFLHLKPLYKYVQFHFFFHNFFVRRYHDIKLHQGIIMQLFVLVLLVKIIAQ